MKDKDDFVEDKFMSGEKMNYRLLLLMQCNRITSIPMKLKIKVAGNDNINAAGISKLSKEVIADVLLQTVKGLMFTLKPYWDEPFKKDRKNLDKSEKFKVLDDFYEIEDYSWELYGLLKELMGRHNLLLEEEGEDVVE